MSRLVCSVGINWCQLACAEIEGRGYESDCGTACESCEALRPLVLAPLRAAAWFCELSRVTVIWRASFRKQLSVHKNNQAGE